MPAWETACSGKAQLAVDPWFRNQQGKTTAKLGSRSTSQTLGYFRGGTSQASGRLENFHHCLLQSSLISGELTIPPATQRPLYEVGKGPTPESSGRTHCSPQSLGHRGPLERPELRQRGTRDSWRNQKQPKQEAAFAPGGRCSQGRGWRVLAILPFRTPHLKKLEPTAEKDTVLNYSKATL